MKVVVAVVVVVVMVVVNHLDGNSFVCGNFRIVLSMRFHARYHSGTF